jgi:putative ABC transport system permease protein
LTLDGYLYQVRDLLVVFAAASYFLLSLIVGLVMIGITVTYRVIVVERTKEIGTMRALGLPREAVVTLFLVEALLTALAAMLAGGIGALLCLRALSSLSFDWIPGFEIFMEQGHIAPYLPLQVVAVNVLIVCAVTLLAAWVPARLAARVKPALAQRSEA